MKNKKVKLGIIVMAAVTLFTATAFAANSNNGGYEVFKEVMKSSQETKHFANASFDGAFKMIDNGKEISEITGEVKGTREDKEASGNVQFKLMGKEQDLSFYRSGETSYLVDQTNAKYYQLVNIDKDQYKKHKAIENNDGYENHQMGKTGEAFMDYFVGDLKYQFELSENTDGTKSITLDLDQNEIPVPINLLMGIAADGSDRSDVDCEDGMDLAQKELLMGKMPFLKIFSDLGKDIPKLKEDIKLTGIVLKLNVDENNQIKSFDAKINTTGKDANGEYHEISLLGSLNIKDINSTTVDKFSPDGKSIETIDAEDFKCSRD